MAGTVVSQQGGSTPDRAEGHSVRTLTHISYVLESKLSLGVTK